MNRQTARKNSKTKAFDLSTVCLEVCVTATWLTQFIMLINYRFSHTGKVCSGDYAIDEMSDDAQFEENKKFNIYYLLEEGKFFYYYLISLAILSGVFVFLACCMGGVTFFSGSFVSLKFIEQAISGMEDIPGMMKPKSKEEKEKDEYMNYGPPDEERQQDPRSDEARFRA